MLTGGDDLLARLQRECGHPVERCSSARRDARLARRPLLRAGLTLGAAITASTLSTGGVVAATLGRSSASPPAPNVVIQWNQAALAAVGATHLGPPMVARALAILHTCIYDAWAAYDPVAVGTNLGGAMRRTGEGQARGAKQQAISYAAYRALADLFPTELARFDALMASLGFDPANTSTDTHTPQGIGNVAAQAVLAARHQDGSNQLGDLHPGAYTDYTGYVPVNTPETIIDPNRWQPLRVPDGPGRFVVQTYVAPFWALVAPFALTSGAQLRPATGPQTTPYGPGTSPAAGYVAQARQLLAYSAGLTDEQKVIAEYWADGPHSEQPPGHWCLFGQFVSQRDQHSLDEDATLFFALTNALFDASIACWDCKRAFDSVRPVTAIHYLFAGQQVSAWAGPYQGTGLIDGGTWQPYQPATVVTPPFPEFSSGHSTFSAAGAEILRTFTGSDAFGASYTQRAGSSRVEPGLTPAHDLALSWATFSEAANQAGLSRRYGGIHFAQGDLAGRAMGRLIGARAWRKAHGYLNGDPTCSGLE